MCLITGWVVNEAKNFRITLPARCGYVSPGTPFTIVSALISLNPQSTVCREPYEYITPDNIMALDNLLAVLFVENWFSIDVDVRRICMHAGCFFFSFFLSSLILLHL
jgi:hypothetical protein